MHITLASIGSPSRSQDSVDSLVRDYLKRSSAVARCGAEAFRNEAAFFNWVGRQKGRTEPSVLLLDGSGRQMSSEALAEWLRARRDDGTQHVVFAIGPADGWSDEARAEGKRRGTLLSLGTMTLAHQLARLVMAEQIYRACTILTGHPYHKGH
ncbi:MAG TPA: 23S rRNA (pseudouridine(1915)-N(3))-methyltransferase RlmH [Terracidiphilus sp.]|jgi:23S rRNA (pseudouridine1915-N3)-methyltransferase